MDVLSSCDIVTTRVGGSFFVSCSVSRVKRENTHVGRRTMAYFKPFAAITVDDTLAVLVARGTTYVDLLAGTHKKRASSVCSTPYYTFTVLYLHVLSIQPLYHILLSTKRLVHVQNNKITASELRTARALYEYKERNGVRIFLFHLQIHIFFSLSVLIFSGCRAFIFSFFLQISTPQGYRGALRYTATQHPTICTWYDKNVTWYRVRGTYQRQYTKYSKHAQGPPIISGPRQHTYSAPTVTPPTATAKHQPQR